MHKPNVACLKILVSAYACRPGEGSEPGVGWNVVRELGRYHNIWVITRQNNRRAIEAALKKNPLSGLHVIYCEPSRFVHVLNHNQRVVYLHYYLWQLQAYFVARRFHQKIGFDLVHHVTYVRYSSPSFLSLLPIPFIWGPVGGGEVAPEAFWAEFSLRGKVYEIIRRLAHRFGEQDPFTRLTARRSVLARATTEDTAKRLRHMGAKNVEVASESGLSQAEIARLQRYAVPHSSTIRFISMARLLHWKGLHLGIRAFAHAQLPSSEYWIVGDGAERHRLQALVEALGITDQVTFFGRLTREETLHKLGASHVLVHPSLHDSGGWVCIEAMAAGRPVICLDVGGPSIQVTGETGFKIPAQSPQQAVEGLAKAMQRLANDPTLQRRMGQAGQQRVKEQFAWEVKGQSLAHRYADLLT